MKFPGLVFFLSLAFFLQCERGVSDAPNSRDAVRNTDSRTAPADRNANKMNEVFSSKGKKDEIEYRITARLQKKGQSDGVNYPSDNVVVEYELKNTGTKDFILYNQGHSSDGGAFVYVEPLADGTVELSLKAFTEPAGKNCPARFVAVMPRGSLLKAGAIVEDKVYVELPLKTKTPFDDCAPKTEVAPNASKIKFCLGYQEAPGENLKIDADGNLAPLPDLRKQSVLCSEIFEIK